MASAAVTAVRFPPVPIGTLTGAGIPRGDDRACTALGARAAS